jgi:AraC-like DNA-binding protein
MLVTHLRPCPELAPFVRTFTVVETREQDATRSLLPDGGMALGIRFGGFARQLDEAPERNLPNATLAGMRASARRMYTSANAGVVLAQFRTGGAAAFFAEPLHGLFGKTAPLDAFVPRSAIERTADRVTCARSHPERVHALEQLLLERLRANSGDRVVSAALEAINGAKGTLRITELARALDLSRDRLEKRFRLAVGSSPKQLASLLRIKHAIELHRSGASLTQSALEAGYFDQSHFNREFRLFTGESPSHFFRSTDHC